MSTSGLHLHCPFSLNILLQAGKIAKKKSMRTCAKCMESLHGADMTYELLLLLVSLLLIQKAENPIQAALNNKCALLVN